MLLELIAGNVTLLEAGAEVIEPDTDEPLAVTGLLSLADEADDEDEPLAVEGLLELGDGAEDDEPLALADEAEADETLLEDIVLLAPADEAEDNEMLLEVVGLLTLAEDETYGMLDGKLTVVGTVSGMLATLLAELIVTVTDQLRIIVDKTVEMLGELVDPAL